MSPLPIDLHGKTFADEDEEQTRQRVLRRFEDIGNRMMNRTAAGFGVDADPRKRVFAAQFLGQALVIAYNLMTTNKDKVQAVADAVMDKKEIYGDDLVRLLDTQSFVKPEIDWTNEDSWPKLMEWSRDPRETRIMPEAGDIEGTKAS